MKEYIKLSDFYIREDERHLIKHILPELYIDQNLHKNEVGADYALRFLQNELNSILNSFVNGGFSHKGFILFPAVKDVSKENIKKIIRLKDVAVFLNIEGYDFSQSISIFRNDINSKNFASALSALYVDFSKIKNKKTIPVKTSACREISMNYFKKSDMEFLKPLSELKDYANASLKKYLSGFYLHGSFATMDYIKGWSDVDTLAIISEETMNDPKRLLELRDKMYRLRKFFYKIDPLQHHGSIIISDYDADNYCQPYFPIPIFKYANSFFDNDKEKIFKLRNYEGEAINRLFWFVNYFRKLSIEKRHYFGSYDTKTLLHSIALFPSLYLQAKGILVYKKFSFDMAKKDFRKEYWEAIDDITSIRSSWRYSTSTLPIDFGSSVNPLLYYQVNSRVVDLFKDIKKINKIDTKELIGEMLMLSEEAWSKVKKNAKAKGL